MVLAGKTVVITGNPYGIGRASAALFAREGAQVVCIDDSREGWTAADNANGGRPDYLCDVSDAEALGAVVAACERTLDRVDILFNLAGRTSKHRFEETTEDVWQQMIDRNLTAAFLCSRRFLPLIKKSGGGASIIHHASIDGSLGNPSIAGYSAAKGGLIPLTHVMAHDLRGYGIRVNCISTGGIRDQVRPDDDALVRLTPAGRLGTPDDVAQVALFLASPASSYVNAVNLVVDGGRTTITQGCYGE